MKQYKHNFYIIRGAACILAVFVSITLAVARGDADNGTNSSSAPPFAQSYEAVTSSPNQSKPSILTDLSVLEFRLFAHEYPNEDVVQRLDRLERVVYGSRKTAAIDLRVANLMRDIANAPVEAGYSNGSTSDSNPYTSSPAITASAQPTSLLDLIGGMEKEVFGRTHPNNTLLDRVARLEKSVFPAGSEQNLTPLPARIQNLVLALQPAIHSPDLQDRNSFLHRQTTTSRQGYAIPENTNSTKSQSQSSENKDSDEHPILKKLGKILCGVGTVAGEAVGSMAYGSALSYGAYGWGGYPYSGYFGGFRPYYGYGYGYGGYRW